MTLSEEYALSCYKELAVLREHHSAVLVMNISTRKLFVKKRLEIYDIGVFRYLKEHPVANMPRIVEAVESGKTLTVIEEYLAGDTLQELLDRKGTLPESQALRLTLQLCRIVSKLHRAATPIVHRDIKPSNILISQDGVLKLLDMDAAKLVNGTKTQDTVLLGTAGYAAPEQYGFAASGVQTDIYAIGVLLNVMLTGKLPQEKTCAGSIAAVIQNCTRMDWHERYSSVDEVAKALKKLLPAVEEGPSLAERYQEISRYLLPGLRSGNPVLMLLALTGYAFLGYCFTGLTISGEYTMAELIGARVCFAGCSMSMILFSGNYLNIKSIWRITASKNIFVRWVGTAAVDVALMFAWIVALIIFTAMA